MKRFSSISLILFLLSILLFSPIKSLKAQNNNTIEEKGHVKLIISDNFMLNSEGYNVNNNLLVTPIGSFKVHNLTLPYGVNKFSIKALKQNDNDSIVNYFFILKNNEGELEVLYYVKLINDNSSEEVLFGDGGEIGGEILLNEDIIGYLEENEILIAYVMVDIDNGEIYDYYILRLVPYTKNEEPMLLINVHSYSGSETLEIELKGEDPEGGELKVIYQVMVKGEIEEEGEIEGKGIVNKHILYTPSGEGYYLHIYAEAIDENGAIYKKEKIYYISQRDNEGSNNTSNDGSANDNGGNDTGGDEGGNTGNDNNTRPGDGGGSDIGPGGEPVDPIPN